jgi:hypothetical protein
MGSVVANIVCHPKIRGRINPCAGREKQLEAGRQHANDSGTPLACAQHFLAEHRSAPGISPLPVFMAEDRRTARRNQYLRLGGLRHGVGLVEIAAQCDFCSHEPEKVRSDQGLADLLLAPVLTGYECAEGGDAADVVEYCARAATQVEEISIGIEKVPGISRPALPEHQYQPVRAPVRKGL